MLKSIGMVRKVDELGRLVLPMELRRTMKIDVRDAIEIYTDGDSIVLKKYVPGCVFCGSASGVQDFKGKHVCDVCLLELKKQVG